MTENASGRYATLTIREYENSVGMPDEERVTCLDSDRRVHLKNGDHTAADFAAYAEKCEEYLRFGYEVDDVTCGNYARHEALKICDTPGLYIAAGFRPLPMLFTQRHLLDAIRPKNDYDPHRHGLTIEQVKRLPEQLANPVMLCDSPARADTMLALLRDVDCDGLPLIAAIKPDGHGYYELHEMETNFILAVYGRTDFPRYFEERITSDKVIYFNEEKGRELDALAKLHLLRSHIVEPGLCNRIIRRPQCIVKMEAVEAAGQRLDALARESRSSSAALADASSRQNDRDEADRSARRRL